MHPLCSWCTEAEDLYIPARYAITAHVTAQVAHVCDDHLGSAVKTFLANGAGHVRVEALPELPE